ncbi:MAG TPA: hypothetical protein VH370_21710 [Humisphaera sp.]|jgi:hypothetical protein|nr:hypothetical protein [Humisphaera sp.]
MSEGDPSDAPYICPHCGVNIPRSEGPMLQCAACQELLVTQENSLEQESHPAAPRVGPTAEDELSHLRILQISTLRRTAARARSYCIIGAGVFLITAIELGLRVAGELRTNPDPLKTLHNEIALQSLVAIAAIWGLWYFTRRIIALTRELSQTMLDEPNTPPDFSTLSDGSQPIRDLENMHNMIDD